MPRPPVVILVLILALASGAVALAAGAVLAAPPRVASNDAEVVRHFYAALNAAIRSGDLAPLDALLAPDYVDHPAPTDDTPARAALMGAVRDLHAADPALHVAVESVAAEGDTVVVRSHVAPGGDDVAAPQAAGFAAVGRRIDVFRVEGGRVAEHW